MIPSESTVLVRKRCASEDAVDDPYLEVELVVGVYKEVEQSRFKIGLKKKTLKILLRKYVEKKE